MTAGSGTTTPTPELVSHLERFLGPIVAGYADDTGPTHFQTVGYTAEPAGGTAVFSTLGLSGYPLRSPVSDKDIRLELLMVCAGLGEGYGAAPAVLAQVGEAAVHGDRALVRGDVIGPHGPLFARTAMEALYVSAPVYQPDEFSTAQTPDGLVVIGWLVPITAAEAGYVQQAGWSAFEDLLVEQDPDLTDVHRPELQLT